MRHPCGNDQCEHAGQRGRSLQRAERRRRLGFSRSIPCADTLVFDWTAPVLGLGDGMVAAPDRRKGANTRPRILVCERAARRNRAVPIRSCVLARSYYRCDHLWHSCCVTACECGYSGNIGHRPIVNDAADFHLRAWVVDRQLSTAL